eukprot:gene3835-4426_t
MLSIFIIGVCVFWYAVIYLALSMFLYHFKFRSSSFIFDEMSLLKIIKDNVQTSSGDGAEPQKESVEINKVVDALSEQFGKRYIESGSNDRFVWFNYGGSTSKVSIIHSSFTEMIAIVKVPFGSNLYSAPLPQETYSYIMQGECQTITDASTMALKRRQFEHFFIPTMNSFGINVKDQCTMLANEDYQEPDMDQVLQALAAQFKAVEEQNRAEIIAFGIDVIGGFLGGGGGSPKHKEGTPVDFNLASYFPKDIWDKIIVRPTKGPVRIDISRLVDRSIEPLLRIAAVILDKGIIKTGLAIPFVNISGRIGDMIKPIIIKMLNGFFDKSQFIAVKKKFIIDENGDIVEKRVISKEVQEFTDLMQAIFNYDFERLFLSRQEQ